MSPLPGRVLAVDLGERRIGVAVCDETRLAVRPLGVIESVGPKRDAKAIRALAEGLEIVAVVVGLPLDRGGDEGEKAKAARERGRDLARRLELPLHFADETGSTVEARERLIAAGTRRARRRVVDADAAAVILETWLAEPDDAG